jgi:Ferric reductase NAD binding domain
MSSVSSAKNRLQNIWVWNGRPNWDIIFQDMKAQRQHSNIGVCFCGTPVIGNDLKSMCDTYSSYAEDCVFTLHKENF